MAEETLKKWSIFVCPHALFSQASHIWMYVFPLLHTCIHVHPGQEIVSIHAAHNQPLVLITYSKKLKESC